MERKKKGRKKSKRRRNEKRKVKPRGTGKIIGRGKGWDIYNGNECEIWNYYTTWMQENWK